MTTDRSQNHAIYTICLYAVLSSFAGLFGLSSGTSKFIIYQIVCFLLFFIMSVFFKINDKEQKHVGPNSSEKVLVLYIIIISFSFFYIFVRNDLKGQSIFDLAQFMFPVLFSILFFLCLSKVKLGIKSVEKVLLVILLVSLISSFYSLLFDMDQIKLLTHARSSYELDIKSFFFNRNVFGFISGVGLLLSFYFYTRIKKRRYILFAIVLSLSLLTSMSRGAIIFVAIVLSLTFFYKNRKSPFKIAVISSIAIIILFCIAQISIIQNNFIRADGGDTGRSSLRTEGIKYFLNSGGSLLLGSGQDAIRHIEQRSFGHSSFHNIYIETLVTQGIMGLIAILLIAMYIFKNIKYIRRKDPQLGVFLHSFTVAYFVYAFFESLPLFYGTSNSVIVSYITVLIPAMYANWLKEKNDDK